MYIKNKELPALLYIVLCEIMYGFKLTTLNFPNIIYTVLQVLALVSLIISMFIAYWTVKETFKALGLITIGLCVYLSSGETLFLLLIGFCLVMKGLSNYKIALKSIFVVKLGIAILVIFLSLVGVLPNKELPVSKGGYGWVYGYSLGFTHPNGLAVTIFLLCLMYICIRNEKLNFKDCFFIFLVELCVTFITKNRTTLFLVLLMFMMFSIKNKKRLNNFFPVYFLCISIIGILVPYLYTTATGGVQNFLYNLNGVLNGRLSNSVMLIQSQRLTLFGKIIDLNKLQNIYGYNVVDNSYIFTLFNYGIIGMGLIIFLYLYTIKKLCKKQEYIYVIVLCIFLTLSIMENGLRTVAMNFTTIFWCEFLVSTNYNLNKGKF